MNQNSVSNKPADERYNASEGSTGIERREFLARSSGLAMGLALGGSVIELRALAEDVGPPKAGPAVECAVIGLGERGREILAALSNLPQANVKTVCDNYKNAHKKALEIAPKAAAVEDYKAVLDDKTIGAVWIATPSHLHKDIALAAIQAGKHVYCEAPLASTIDDAKVIAKAAVGGKQVFQVGLQNRANPQHKHVLTFIKVGALGEVAMMRHQWSKKSSWRRTAPTDERQAALNWRLKKESSGGLLNEVGIHQIDVSNWFLKDVPLAVIGIGSIAVWDDGRELYDTASCIFEYPDGVQLNYSATLGNSHDRAYELFQGSESAVVLRGPVAWMFKEADAQALGWEVYAYKEKIADEEAIALVADATKLIQQGKKPGDHRDLDPKKNELYYACEAFLASIRENKKVACSALEGYQATVTALKAHEAVLTGTKIQFKKEWFELG